MLKAVREVDCLNLVRDNPQGLIHEEVVEVIHESLSSASCSVPLEKATEESLLSILDNPGYTTPAREGTGWDLLHNCIIPSA